MDAAPEFLDAAFAAGHVASIEGNWVVFRPPLPPEMILDAIEMGDALAACLRERAGG